MTSVTLKYPVTHNGKEVSELSFRRARIKDIEAIERAVEGGGEITASITSISCLSGLPEDVVREIDGEDFVQIADVMSDFLPSTITGRAGGN